MGDDLTRKACSRREGRGATNLQMGIAVHTSRQSHLRGIHDAALNCNEKSRKLTEVVVEVALYTLPISVQSGRDYREVVRGGGFRRSLGSNSAGVCR